MIRKVCVCILFVCWIVMAFGCGTSNADAIGVREESVITADKNKIQNMQADIMGEDAEETASYNPYFFCEDQISLAVRAVYGADPLVEETGHLKLYKVHEYEFGMLYKLTVGLEGFDSYLIEERLNIYLYVTENKIYRVWSWIYQDDHIISLNDADLMVIVLDTDEKLIENSVIVCQMEDISVDEEDGEGRYRYSIFKEDDLITYYRSDVQPNGERGFYEWFIWKEGKGLIEYGSGYKREADILYLYDIAIDTEKAFPKHGNKDKRRERADVFIHGYHTT